MAFFITLELRFFVVRLHYTLQHYDSFTLQFVRGSYVFYDVRITLYCDMFELRLEVMLQLRFAFIRHCDGFFVTLQFRYLFFRM